MNNEKILGDVTLQQSICSGQDVKQSSMRCMLCPVISRREEDVQEGVCHVLLSREREWHINVSVRWRRLYNIYFLHRFCSTNQYLWWILNLPQIWILTEKCSERISIFSAILPINTVPSSRGRQTVKMKEVLWTRVKWKHMYGKPGSFLGSICHMGIRPFCSHTARAVVISRVMFHY